MAVLPVNPTRMESTLLKRKLAVAMRGHKLLKEKRDELMRQFLVLVKECTALRRRMERELWEANRSFAMASAVMRPEALACALMLSGQAVRLERSTRNVMSVALPVLHAAFESQRKSDSFSYGYAFTSSSLDESVSKMNALLPILVKLAESEKSLELLAAEIEKTRRRVNALEYVLIPNYRDTIRYITMKLEENERSSIARLMKVKDQMLSQRLEGRG